MLEISGRVCSANVHEPFSCKFCLEIITSRDATSACIKCSRTSCDVTQSKWERIHLEFLAILTMVFVLTLSYLTKKYSSMCTLFFSEDKFLTKGRGMCVSNSNQWWSDFPRIYVCVCIECPIQSLKTKEGACVVSCWDGNFRRFSSHWLAEKDCITWWMVLWYVVSSNEFWDPLLQQILRTPRGPREASKCREPKVARDTFFRSIAMQLPLTVGGFWRGMKALAGGLIPEDLFSGPLRQFCVMNDAWAVFLGAVNGQVVL